jgi:phage terminase small subunit
MYITLLCSLQVRYDIALLRCIGVFSSIEYIYQGVTLPHRKYTDTPRLEALQIVTSNGRIGRTMDMQHLTLKQRRFVNEYCVDENATQATIRAGYSENGAGQQGHLLLKNIDILAAIEERKAEVAVAASVTPEWVASQWAKLARADPNDLSQVRRVNCRYCNGVDHAYQWTQAEYLRAVELAVSSKLPAPDGLGGFGFDPAGEPAEDCPECGGLGAEEVYFADTRKLKGSAKLLYAGVQKTRDGMKVLTRDQDAALNNLARYLGMLVDRKELSGPNGGPVAVATLTAEDLTDDQLAALLHADEATGSD